MSSTEHLRAMREAKYARARAASGRPAPTPAAAAAVEPAPVAPPAPRTRKTAAKPTTAKGAAKAAATTEPDTSVCGHRNMSGRTCTREAGHAAKSHRYS